DRRFPENPDQQPVHGSIEDRMMFTHGDFDYFLSQTSGTTAKTTTESPTAPATGSKPFHRQSTTPRSARLATVTSSNDQRERELGFVCWGTRRSINFSRAR